MRWKNQVVFCAAAWKNQWGSYGVVCLSGAVGDLAWASFYAANDLAGSYIHDVLAPVIQQIILMNILCTSLYLSLTFLVYVFLVYNGTTASQNVSCETNDSASVQLSPS